MNLKQTQGASQELTMEGKQLQKAEALEEIRAPVAAAVMRAIRKHLQECRGTLKITIHDNNSVFEEFLILTTEDCLIRYATELDQIRKKSSIEKILATVESIVEKYKLRMENLLSGSLKISSLSKQTGSSGPLDQRYARLLEEGARTQHFGYLLKTGQVQLRDFKTDRAGRKEDIDLFRRLYKKNQIAYVDLLRFAAKKDSPPKLLANPENHEIPDMEKLLERTAELKKLDTVDGRRAFETMYARFAHGPLGPDDILGVSVHTLSPMDPKKDREYREKNEVFIAGGVSGGILTTSDDIRKLLGEYRLGKGGRSQDLYFIMGAVPGIAKYTLADGIKNLPDIQEHSKFFTYTLSGLNMTVNDTPLPGPVSEAQNRKCLNLLLDAGYTTSGATDQNDEQPYTTFYDGKFSIGARPIWTHLSAEEGALLEWANSFRL